MSFADKVVTGFKAQSLKSIMVPEWGEKVYFRPLTLAEAQAVERERDEIEKVFELLFVKLLDEGGDRLFPADKKAEARAALVDSTSTETINMIADEIAPKASVDAAKNG